MKDIELYINENISEDLDAYINNDLNNDLNNNLDNGEQVDESLLGGLEWGVAAVLAITWHIVKGPLTLAAGVILVKKIIKGILKRKGKDIINSKNDEGTRKRLFKTRSEKEAAANAASVKGQSKDKFLSYINKVNDSYKTMIDNGLIVKGHDYDKAANDIMSRFNDLVNKNASDDDIKAFLEDAVKTLKNNTANKTHLSKSQKELLADIQNDLKDGL